LGRGGNEESLQKTKNDSYCFISALKEHKREKRQGRKKGKLQRLYQEIKKENMGEEYSVLKEGGTSN